MVLKTCRLLILILSSLLVGRVVSQQSEQSSLRLDRAHIITEDFSKYARKLLDEGNVKGLSLAIVKANDDADGDVEFGSWGLKTEMEVSLIPSIGSCTKAFMATSLGILMDDFATGKNVTPLPSGVTEFNWQSKLVDLLPGEWELKDKWANEKADVRDILSHNTGLAGHDEFYGPNDTEKDVVLRLRHLDTPLEFRERPSYNNAMYMTAARLLSVYANRTFHEFAKERIFKPLGMDATTMSPTEAERSGHLSHTWSAPLLDSNGQTKHGRRIPYWFSEETQQFISGAGAIISNAEDMAKWVDTLLHKGVIPSTNETVIPRTVFDAVTTSSVIWLGHGDKHDSISGYGMGWFRQSSNGHEIISHAGGVPGFLSLVAFFPHERLGLVSLTNTDQGNIVTDALQRRIIVDYFGQDVSELLSESTELFSPRPSRSLTQNKDVHNREADSLDDFVGTYTNLGYGNITLCSSEDTSPSSTCASVVRDFAIVDKAAGRLYEPSLVAHWPRVWNSHLRVAPQPNTVATQDRFVMTPSTLFVEGYGKDESPWEYAREGVSVRFVRDELRSEPGKGWVAGFEVCGLAGRMDIVGDACERFEAGDEVNKGLLVHFEKVEAL